MASGRRRLLSIGPLHLRPLLKPGSGGLVLWSLAAVLLLGTCGGPALSIQSSLTRASFSLLASRAKVRALHPEVALKTERITTTADQLTLMMAEDVTSNRPYLDWLRSSQGDAAATRMEDAIRAPYLRRIEQMNSLGIDRQDFDIQVAIVWDSLTFSTRSYDASFSPMDPVSVLFTGNGSPDDVFANMVSAPECLTDAQCTAPVFQDDKGTGAHASGFACRSSVQWVLMGNTGQPLQWVPSTRGVMKISDRCTQGVREHMRIFGGLDSPVFGTWSVGTPHLEVWGDGTGRLGHFIQSWVNARNDVELFWDGLAKRKSGFGIIQPDLSLGSAGIFQKTEFDGQAAVIDLCPCP
jgi:hypothetical protein